MPAFRRQHPIGPYVLDFYCAKARLAIVLMESRTTWETGPSAKDWLEAQGITSPPDTGDPAGAQFR
jgi:very-short-patch-repair endonuclease